MADALIDSVRAFPFHWLGGLTLTNVVLWGFIILLTVRLFRRRS